MGEQEEMGMQGGLGRKRGDVEKQLHVQFGLIREM